MLESCPVRLWTIPILLLLAPFAARADIIHLKNGRTIWADQVRENKNHVEYDVGEDTYAIPKSAVDHVETGGLPPQYVGSHADTHDAADFIPATPTFNHTEEVAGKVVHDGKVDTDALTALEREGNPEVAATGYFVAGKHEFDRGNLPQARQYLESALRFRPQNAILLTYYAAVLLRTGKATDALPFAERAVRAAPDSPDAQALLGFVQMANDRTPDAIRSWKKSLKLRPDDVVSQHLARAERESNTESEFALRESTHFTLHFEGKQTPQGFPQQVLAVLEQDFDDIERDLDYSPHSSILVTLYTEQAFFDVTQAPSWISALNDGKLRIPVRGISSMTPELARVLKHELTHSFLTEMSGGRCPTWLQEGVAQMEEGKSSGSVGHQLGALFVTNSEIPYNMLEGGFMRFSSEEAVLAYAESLAAVEFIRDVHGLSEISRIVRQLNQGSSTEAAMRSVIHTDYGQLHDEMTRWLKDKYGQ